MPLIHAHVWADESYDVYASLPSHQHVYIVRYCYEAGRAVGARVRQNHCADYERMLLVGRRRLAAGDEG